METKITHWHDSTSDIFYKYYHGNIDFDDIVSHWIALIGEKQLPHGIKRFILDYRKANLLTPPDKAKDIAQFYRSNATEFQHAKIALIMQKPDQVILPILANDELPGFLELKPFYTLEGAVEWIESQE